MPAPINSAFVSDLHLTNDSRDEYRWRIFDVLEKMRTTHQFKTLYILGDLTEAKDGHNSYMVNRIVNCLIALRNKKCRIYVLRGNHDGIDPMWPYFGFLSYIPDISFIRSGAKIFTEEKARIWAIPHIRSWKEFDFKFGPHEGVDLIIAHITVNGAKSAIPGARELTGIPLSDLDELPKCEFISGDVHKPQTVGRVEYIGAPYHINYGDDFKPRMFINDHRGESFDISLDKYFPHRRMMEVTNSQRINASFADLYEGDQTKWRVHLTLDDMHEWENISQRIRTRAKRDGIEVASVSFILDNALIGAEGAEQGKADTDSEQRMPWQTREALEKFCRQNEVPSDLRRIGMECYEASAQHG
jgi:DNA repair exonuclease SbcCD nuclease subunit